MGVYSDGSNSNYGTAVVGTVSSSDNSITFGTPVVFDSLTARNTVVAYDANAGKVVVAYYGFSSPNTGLAIVGTVSGSSISFGSRVTMNATGPSGEIGIVYAPDQQKIVCSYRDQYNSNYGTAIVGTVSGTSISFGTEVVFNSGTTYQNRLGYDTTKNRVLCAYRDNSNSNYGTIIAGTVSGTSITFGSEAEFHNSSAGYPKEIVHDSVNNINVIVYGSSSEYGLARTVSIDTSDNSLTFGTAAQFKGNSIGSSGAAGFNAAAGKIDIIYKDEGDNNKAKFVTATVSGTSISYSSETTVDTNQTDFFSVVYNTTLKNNFIAYSDETNTQGEAFINQLAYTETNLTAENYIGMSRGSVSTFDKSYGSVATYSTNNTNFSSIAYDSNSNKIVIAYADDTDTTGKAVIGTVDSANNTISFGTPVTFNSGTTQWVSVVFDSNSNKVVISYRDAANNYYGTSIVGTVSGTSISFGTEVVFKSTYTEDTNMTFDTTANKVVLSYKVGGSNTGNAIVGTVSGTSISFGSEATFESGDPDTGADIVYDANADKTVIVYRDIGDSSKGKAVVGTVSGTSISFGTPVVYNTSGTSYSKVVYNSVDNNVVVAYRTASSGARARVGTVSGTTISFGDEATVASTSGVFYIGLGYNPQTNRLALAYGDTGNSNQGTIFEGTISGNTLSFDSGTIFNTNRTQWSAMAYDSTADRIVLNFEAHGDSGRGKAMVIETGGVTRGEVADGNPASLDIIGSVSDNQLSLTSGEKYYVQTDGTLSTTAGSPSVLAGTAITSSKLLVKT